METNFFLSENLLFYQKIHFFSFGKLIFSLSENQFFLSQKIHFFSLTFFSFLKKIIFFFWEINFLSLRKYFFSLEIFSFLGKSYFFFLKKIFFLSRNLSTSPNILFFSQEILFSSFEQAQVFFFLIFLNLFCNITCSWPHCCYHFLKIACKFTTLNPEIFKKIPGRVRVVKKSPGRVG